jgi:hypothetical protein
VPVDIAQKTWLLDLVAEALDGYDPAAARLRLPREVRDPDPDGPSLEARARMLVVRSLRRRLVEPGGAEGPTGEAAAFLAPVEEHVALLLDLALLHGGPFDAARRRAEVGAVFAAAFDDLVVALACQPDPVTGDVSDAVTRKALVRAGAGLRQRAFPPGDPTGGIRLYAGTVAVQRRLLARIALSRHRQGGLEPGPVRDYLAYAARELTLLVEALAGLSAAGAPPGQGWHRVVARQIRRLRLPRRADRAARLAAGAPRPAEEVAREAPAKMRTFLVEQLLLASLGDPPAPGRTAYVQAFADAAQISPEQLAAMQVEAAAFQSDHKAWFRAFGLPEEPEWEGLAEEWNALGEHMIERVAAVVTENLGAIATEIRQTGELGQLLAKAAAGKALSAAEKRKVKDQLIDLAKAVPALAIFAAPGGLLLLPLLAKVLPFNFLPSAFQPENGRKPPRPGQG